MLLLLLVVVGGVLSSSSNVLGQLEDPRFGDETDWADFDLDIVRYLEKMLRIRVLGRLSSDLLLVSTGSSQGPTAAENFTEQGTLSCRSLDGGLHSTQAEDMCVRETLELKKNRFDVKYFSFFKYFSFKDAHPSDVHLCFV